MSSSVGPTLTTTGLVLNIDAANRKSYISAAGQITLINTSTWTVSTGSVTNFPCNGSTTENQRIVDTDPWGNQSIVWGTYADGVGAGNGADGGWEGTSFAIDSSKTYRSSVWVRRTSSTSAGTYYFGLHSNGTGDTYRIDNGVSETNPYWDYRGTSSFVQNTWYLNVGHVFPSSYSGTTVHPNSGFWSLDGSKYTTNAGNVPYDVKFPSNATTAMQRVYHYYCADATTRLQFAFPRWDLVDGKEPSIHELLTKPASKFIDSTGNNNNGTITGTINFNKTNGIPVFSLNTTSKILTPINYATGTYTVIAGVRFTAGTHGRIVSATGNNWLLGHWGSTENHYAEGWVTSAGVGTNDNTWRILAASGNTTTDSYQMYVNGTQTASNNGGSAGPNGLGVNCFATEPSDCEFSFLMVYNRVLTTTEIQQAFLALRGRYSI